jgi:hypothetical protein
MATRRTRGEAAIESLLAQLDPESERYRVLSAAREFKASWVELGQRLTEVRESEEFKQWGHSTFESYCRQELRLKSDTANKLTRSFSFLRDHEPDVLSERTERELPALDVVDLLTRARERAKVSDAQLRTIQEEVFAADGPPTRSEVVKLFREHDPDAFRGAPRPEKKPGVVNEGDLKKALLLAERLQALIEPMDNVSRSAQAGVRAVTLELKKLFEQQVEAVG